MVWWPIRARVLFELFYKRIYEVLDNREWIRILPSSVHDIFWLLQTDNSIQADKFVSIGRHVSSILFKRYWLKTWIKYNFLNRSIDYRDPLHRNSAHRKINSISDIVIQQFLITRTIFFKKELNSASGKKYNWKKNSPPGR